MTNKLLAIRESVAKSLFENKSFKVDLENGFKVAIHQKYPDAPLSPFYLNMRPEGVKGGTLTPGDIKCIATAIWQKGEVMELFGTGRPMAAIPDAGTPFMNAITELLKNARHGEGLPHEFHLKKQLDGEVRSFILADQDPPVYQNTLLVDDLITSAISKFLAREPIIARGGSVTDVLVFLNRSLSARDELAKHGIYLHAVWEFDHFIEWVYGRGYLNRHQYEAIMEYPQRLSTYLKKQPAV